MWKNLGCLAVAGGMGTCARFGVMGLTQRIVARSAAPGSAGDAVRLAGTLAVNVMGCFLFGLLWALVADRVRLQHQAQQMLFVGFLGAFTTFSTFAFEVGHLIRAAKWNLAVTTLFAHNGLGLLAVLLGIAIGRAI